jgi:hypothetical protein|tara:strand:- start:2162 stop:2371 length:210 start_codon:yes stop_codon:yes gene_type:complete
MDKFDLEEQFVTYLQGMWQRHASNYELLLDKPQSIPEHTDFFSALENELAKMAYYDELMDAIHNRDKNT